MVSESQMIAEFLAGYDFPPMRFRLVKDLRANSAAGSNPDAILEATSEGQRIEFEAEFKSRSSPQTFEAAIGQITGWQTTRDRHPLLVMPYLRESQLARLWDLKLSGIDLCGNGVVTVPDKAYVFRTGGQ
ncbi:MAG TPA: hypothetical protein VHB77_19595, partial [Planctomycetaceae bacterium]|nr:hypothetical protein [Planctomycetaceae bacterium]